MELPNVLWIGGPAGAGKTTVARLLARRHGLRWYSSDTRTWEHRDRALADGVTLPDRGPGSAHYDRRPMMIDDLRSLPASPLIVADGPLTPGMVESRPDITRQAVWLLPSKEVQHARLRIRHPEGVPLAYLQSWESTVRKFEESGITGIRVDHLTVAETLREVE
jgi:cytidylate kinase